MALLCHISTTDTARVVEAADHFAQTRNGSHTCEYFVQKMQRNFWCVMGEGSIRLTARNTSS